MGPERPLLCPALVLLTNARISFHSAAESGRTVNADIDEVTGYSNLDSVVYHDAGIEDAKGFAAFSGASMLPMILQIDLSLCRCLALRTSQSAASAAGLSVGEAKIQRVLDIFRSASESIVSRAHAGLFLLWTESVLLQGCEASCVFCHGRAMCSP